jgi:hypothetical protein
MRSVFAASLLALAVPLRAAAAAPAAAFGNAPYDAPPAKTGRVKITFDFSAADQILAALSAEKLNPTDPSTLQSLPAVRRQIADAGKETSVFAADLAGAFLPESRPSTFDFRSVRLDRDRWKVALAALTADREKLGQVAERRAEALLPADVALEYSADVQVTFALAGLEDHVLFPNGERRLVVLIDLGRTLAENAGTPREEAEEALSRLAAAEVFRVSWDAYRRTAPGWQKIAASPVDPLERAVSAAGPVALFAFDRNFFPLSRWIHDDMIRAIDALNQELALLADPKTDLAKRSEILATLRRPGLRGDPAVSAGVFLADGVFQAQGAKALLDALAAGPEGLFAAYEAASSAKKSGLPPLSPKWRTAHDRR